MDPHDSPSNREVVTPDGGVGVDTFAVRGPAPADLPKRLRHIRTDRSLQELGVDSLTRAWERVDVGKTTAWVGADRRTGPLEVRIEVGMPSALNGHNTYPVPLCHFHEAADAILDVLSRELPLPDAEDFRLTRLDLVRDFRAITDIDGTLRALADGAPRQPLTQIQYEGREGNLATLVRTSPKRWDIRAYDKGEELRAKSRRGAKPTRALLHAWGGVIHDVLRWELQLRSAVLRQDRIDNPMSVSPESLEATARKFFIRQGFGVILSRGSAHAAAALQRLVTAGRSADERLLAQYLTNELLGVAGGMSHNTRDRARALAREVGLVPTDLLPSRGVPGRLDFDSGALLEGDQALTGIC